MNEKAALERITSEQAISSSRMLGIALFVTGFCGGGLVTAIIIMVLAK